MYTVEALFFPTRIILIDDDKDFLKAMSNHLSKYFQVETYHNPHKALDDIKKSQSDLKILDPINFIIEDEKEPSDVRLDLTKIHAFLANKEKYNLLTIIISDYDYGMLKINGLTLFEQLSNVSAMKILLTGKSDLTLALDAFNRGLVNRFLIKNTEKMLEEIVLNIISCQHAFFDKKSYPLLSHINIPNDSLLHRTDFSYYFMNLIQNFDISEYYLIDPIGSFILITKTGQTIYFVCILERQFDEYLDIAMTSNASLEVVNCLKKREQAPVFISEDAYKLPVKDWKSISYPFEKKEGYYFYLSEKQHS